MSEVCPLCHNFSEMHDFVSKIEITPYLQRNSGSSVYFKILPYL